jgi:hypothetical protein
MTRLPKKLPAHLGVSGTKLRTSQIQSDFLRTSSYDRKQSQDDFSLSVKMSFSSERWGQMQPE